MIHIGKVFKSKHAQNLVERTFLLPNSKSLNSFSYDCDIEHDLYGILEIAKEHQIVLLSDEPGMGKSTSFRMLHLKLQQKQTFNWIVFIDLKEHYKSYQVDKKITSKFESRNEITNFFCEKILNIQSFEAQVFKSVFDNNRVVFLMDGLDEICPTYKNFIFNLMSAIKRLSKNQLWISTRPHLASEVENIFQPLTLRLKSFTKKNRHDFFRNILTRNSKPQNIENKLKEVGGFFDKLESNSRCDSSSNPLVYRLIAEICSYNFKPMNTNLFTVYNEFTNKMIEKCMNKGPESWKFLKKSLEHSHIEKFYQKIAFQVCFAFENHYEFFEDFFFLMVITPPLEDIARVGLMFPDCFGRFHFLHRNFANFFVAKIFYETIFAPERILAEEELEAITELIVGALGCKIGSKSNMIGIFLENALESFEANFDLGRVQISKKLCKKILDFDTIANLINEGSIKLIKTICLHLGSDCKKMLLEKSSSGRNLLMVALDSQATGFIDQFLSLVRNFFTLDDLRNMFFELDQFNINVIHCAALNECTEVFGFLIRQIDSFISRDELRKLLLQKNFFGETVIQSALKLNRDLGSVLETILKIFSKLQ